MPRTAADRIATRSTEDQIVTASAVDLVGAPKPSDNVVAVGAHEYVRAGGANNRAGRRVLVANQLGHRDLRMLQRHYRHRIRPTISGGAIVDRLLTKDAS